MLPDRFQRLYNLAQRATSSTLADVLDGSGHWGYIDVDVHALNTVNKCVFGQAFTVHWSPTRKTHDIKALGPSTWSEVEGFLAPALENASGRVYVGGAGPLIKQMALAGGLSCTYFAQLGFEGALLGGAVRDAAVIKCLGMPVFATNFTPADTQGAYRVTNVGGATTIASTLVSTGDWIFADASGALVISDDVVENALRHAVSIEETEARIMTRIKTGERLTEIVNAKEGRI